MNLLLPTLLECPHSLHQILRNLSESHERILVVCALRLPVIENLPKLAHDIYVFKFLLLVEMGQLLDLVGPYQVWMLLLGRRSNNGLLVGRSARCIHLVRDSLNGGWGFASSKKDGLRCLASETMTNGVETREGEKGEER